MACLLFFIILLDQISKFLAIRGGGPIFYNQGGFLGLFNDFLWIEAVAWGSLIALLIYCWKRREGINFLEQVSFSFLIGGGIANQIDKWRYRAVIDFIDLKFWPIFNFADVFITFGTILILLDFVRSIPCSATGSCRSAAPHVTHSLTSGGPRVGRPASRHPVCKSLV